MRATAAAVARDSAPLASLAPWSCLSYMHRRVHGTSQDGKQPLHYAAAKGVPFDVTELLLDANHEAAATVDKARSYVHIAPPTLPSHAVCFARPATITTKSCADIPYSPSVRSSASIAAPAKSNRISPREPMYTAAAPVAHSCRRRVIWPTVSSLLTWSRHSAPQTERTGSTHSILMRARRTRRQPRLGSAKVYRAGWSALASAPPGRPRAPPPRP